MIGKNEMDLFKTSFKEVYAELMRSRKKPANIWVEKWENDLGINSKEWEGFWRNVHCHMLNPYVQSTVMGNSPPKLHVRIFCTNCLQ